MEQTSDSKKRLTAVAELIAPCTSLTDIGCDHGYTLRYALDHGLCKQATACDISAPSLEKAKKLLGSRSNVSFLCADGALALQNEPDTVVISGLGGPEMVRMLPYSVAQTLILQPQNRVCDVRAFLSENGYRILVDRVVFERGKFYDVLLARRGVQQLTALQVEWGVFYREPSPLLQQKLLLYAQNLTSYAPTAANTEKIQKIQEVLSWQLR